MRVAGWGIALALLTAVSSSASAQTGTEPTVHKLATLRGSGCDAAGILSGDPAKAPSIIVEKFEPGCAIPWHWHTPNEHLMMVTGTYRVEIKGEQPVELSAGDFARIPSRRVMQVTCVGTNPCVSFLYTDAPIDMHFVDESGTEISHEQALKEYARTHPTRGK